MRFLVFLIATAAFAQADTQALQALVNEIHQLRVDLQTTTIATQRVQIVLFRLQSETTLAARATSRLDDARSAFSQNQAEKSTAMARVAQVEESLRNTQNQTERKTLEEVIPHMKADLARVTNDEQRLQSRLIDAETQNRSEQAKLNDLQDQLDRLDKVLDSFTKK